MSAFPNVNLLKAALFTSTGVTIQPGKTLTLAGAATATFEAVPFKQFDDRVTILDASLNAVKRVIDDVIQDASGSFNSLVELYQISKTIESTGVASLTAETTARIAKDAELDSRLFTIIDTAFTLAVVPDAQPPAMIPAIKFDLSANDLNQFVQDGWYYRNNGPANNSSLNKINWYTSPNATTVGQLKEINLITNLFSTTSYPFITVYTKFQGPTQIDGINNWGVGKQNAAFWYHGRYTFVAQPGSRPTDKGKYNLRASIDKYLDPLKPYIGSTLGLTNVDMPIEVFNSTVEGNTRSLAVIPLLPTDEILTVSFGTDSSSAIGNVEFILSGINYYCTPGNLGYRFSNNSVVSKAIMNANGWGY
jgi:hypothetical protein